MTEGSEEEDDGRGENGDGEIRGDGAGGGRGAGGRCIGCHGSDCQEGGGDHGHERDREGLASDCRHCYPRGEIFLLLLQMGVSGERNRSATSTTETGVFIDERSLVAGGYPIRSDSCRQLPIGGLSLRYSVLSLFAQNTLPMDSRN